MIKSSGIKDRKDKLKFCNERRKVDEGLDEKK